MIAGIDYSTHAVDVVLLDEDTDAATWHRTVLDGKDAFDRARDVRIAMRLFDSEMWDDVVAIGIEDPRGYNAGALYRIQGAILACLPTSLLVHPLPPSVWRKTVGLPGNASKGHIANFVYDKRARHLAYATAYYDNPDEWPQDACDAYCIALATRTLLVTA